MTTPVPASAQSFAPVVQVKVYYPDGQTLIATVPRRRGVSWLDEVNDPGTGTFQVNINDDVLVVYPDLLQPGNVCKIFLNGLPVKAFFIEDVRPTLVSTGEAADQWVTVSGRGLMSALEHAVVYPEYGLREGTSEDRHFSFASRDGEWRIQTEWRASNAVLWSADNTPRRRQPSNWPDPNAAWLWSSDPALNAEPGRNWFRTVFTLSQTTPVVIYATGDNAFIAYMDGEIVLSSGENSSAFLERFEWRMTLAAGTHTFASVVTNYAGPTPTTSSNPAGWIFSIYRANEAGEPTSDVVIRSTGANTIVKPYGDPPGFTGATIMRELVSEAQARYVQALLPVTFGFSGSADTAGVAWVDKQDRLVKVGTTDLLDLAAQIIEIGMDIDIGPDFVMRAWRKRGVNRGSTVILRPNRDIVNAVSTIRSSKLRNQAVIKFDGGWIEMYSATSKFGYGRREIGISLGTANSIEQTTLAGASALREMAVPEETIPISYTSAQGKQPYADFDIGDTIIVPDALNGLRAARLMSIGGSEDDAGIIQWDLDFYPEISEEAITSVVVSTGGTFQDPSLLYQQQILSDSPWAYYRLFEHSPENGGNGTLYDWSNNGRTMTVGPGSPLYREPGPVDRSMLFSDTSPHYAESPGNLRIMQGIVTLEAWVFLITYPSSASRSPVLCFAQELGHVTHDKGMGVYSDGRVWFMVSQNLERRYLDSTQVLALNTWYHIVCSIGPEGMKMFINGSLHQIRTDTTTGNTDRAMKLFIRGGGADHDNRTSRIRIAEPAAYYQQLSNSRVQSHWVSSEFTA